MSELPPDGDTDASLPKHVRELATVSVGQLAFASGHAMAPWDDGRRRIAPTTARRLERLVRQEKRSQATRFADPEWSREGAIPGLIVAQRYVRGDAFGASRQMAELDSAIRRAAALIARLDAGESVDAWPVPIRPQSGGLWLLDASHGSLNILWTVYGSLVAIATSTPVSLAAFASLVCQYTEFASRIAHRWTVRRLAPDELARRPNAADSPPSGIREETWHERTAKRTMPLIRQAIDEG